LIDENSFIPMFFIDILVFGKFQNFRYSKNLTIQKSNIDVSFIDL